jgi:hypothetical protein
VTIGEVPAPIAVSRVAAMRRNGIPEGSTWNYRMLVGFRSCFSPLNFVLAPFGLP